MGSRVVQNEAHGGLESLELPQNAADTVSLVLPEPTNTESEDSFQDRHLQHYDLLEYQFAKIQSSVILARHWLTDSTNRRELAAEVNLDEFGTSLTYASHSEGRNPLDRNRSSYNVSLVYDPQAGGYIGVSFPVGGHGPSGSGILQDSYQDLESLALYFKREYSELEEDERAGFKASALQRLTSFADSLQESIHSAETNDQKRYAELLHERITATIQDITDYTT